MKKFVIIDGKSVFYRGYYAMPGLSTADGTPTGGVYGFASLALEIIRRLEPDYVAVAWDKPKTNIRKRLEIYDKYKAGRKPAPDDFYAQIPVLHDLLRAFGWPLYECDDYEADDIMGTLSKQANEQGIETILVSSDLDMLQIVDHDTKMYALKKGLTNIEEFDIAALEEKYGIHKDQFLDLKALKGDSSDNIPGVPGIGEKTAIDLLDKYGTLDNIFVHATDERPAVAKKLLAGKDSAYMSKKLAQIWFDAPVKFDPQASAISNLDCTALQAELKKLEFNSLLRRIPKCMTEESQQIELLAPERPIGENFTTPDGTFVAFDVKKLFHDQHLDPAKLPAKVYDINQASFLLNPLRRDFAEAGTIQEVYARQSADLANYPDLTKIAYDFDFPLIPILYHMEHKGVQIDTDFFAKFSDELTADLAESEREIYQLVGHEFNINSPVQLSDVLFNDLKLPTTGIKKTARGYGTGQSELDKLRGLHPIIELIEQVREFSKLKSTYVDADSRLHTTFTQNVTATGRLSSLNPNLQNIPIRSDLGRRIRAGFVAGQGNLLVSADYSQFELRLAAVLAGDQPLIDDFNAGIDIHTKTASDVYGIPLAEVTKAQRQSAKVINFGVLYGMSPRGLAVATGMDYYEAKKFIDQYFALRAPIRKFLDDTLNQAKIAGYVETYFGRRRPTPDVNSSNFMIREGAKRAAANMPIQGTEADLMKRAMIQVDAKIGSLGEQILQIHDSILIECPAQNAPEVAQILQSTMESVAPELPIKLSVEVSTGSNWGEL